MVETGNGHLPCCKATIIGRLFAFEDGCLAISYKEGHVDGRPPKSMWHCVLKMKSERAKAVEYRGKLSRTIPCTNESGFPNNVFELVKKDRSWWLRDPKFPYVLNPPLPCEAYSFVTMPDSTIRVALSEKKCHIVISNGAPFVRYAGEVKFDREGMVYVWSNQTGSYLCPPILYFQAGFHGDASRFQACFDRNGENGRKSTFRELN